MASSSNSLNIGGKWLKIVSNDITKLNNFNKDNTLPYTLTFDTIQSSNDVDSTWVVKQHNNILAYYEIHTLENWICKDNIITLYFFDKTYYNLIFFSSYDANLADFRLYLIMNGKTIIGPDDATLYTCGSITGLTIIMS